MTSGSINSFVGDLVEMAKAMETLPQVQADLANAQGQIENMNKAVESLKADLEQSRNYAASLEQKVKTTEAERDDAELRFLELDEKANKVLVEANVVKDALAMIQFTLDPPKPQPEPEPQPQPSVSEAVHSIEAQPQGQGEGNPITTQSEQSSGSLIGQIEAGQGSSSEPQPNPGQGEALPPAQPSASTSDTLNDVGQAPATTTDAGTTGGEGSGVEPSGPYTGKRYYDYPFYVTLSDWLAGGGTEDSFHWRPGTARAGF